MKRRFLLFLYNLDRAIASAIWGTSQETISSEVGRIAKGAGQVDGWTPRWKLEEWGAKALVKWLDTHPGLWGQHHTARAIEHADRLAAADDGKEQ
jgi:hypothetical protein